jgi:hypothetical protein
MVKIAVGGSKINLLIQGENFQKIFTRASFKRTRCSALAPRPKRGDVTGEHTPPGPRWFTDSRDGHVGFHEGGPELCSSVYFTLRLDNRIGQRASQFPLLFVAVISAP